MQIAEYFCILMLSEVNDSFAYDRNLYPQIYHSSTQTNQLNARGRNAVNIRQKYVPVHPLRERNIVVEESDGFLWSHEQWIHRHPLLQRSWK